MAKPGTILVSGNTHRLAREFFQFESLGKVEVKGKLEITAGQQNRYGYIRGGLRAYRLLFFA